MMCWQAASLAWLMCSSCPWARSRRLGYPSTRPSWPRWTEPSGTGVGEGRSCNIAKKANSLVRGWVRGEFECHTDEHIIISLRHALHLGLRVDGVGSWSLLSRPSHIEVAPTYSSIGPLVVAKIARSAGDDKRQFTGVLVHSRPLKRQIVVEDRRTGQQRPGSED